MTLETSEEERVKWSRAARFGDFAGPRRHQSITVIPLLCRDIDTLIQERDAARALLKESYDHHEYCGWGDNWERECAMDSKLPKRIKEALGPLRGTSSP